MCSWLTGVSQQAIGAWREHLSYRQGTAVCQAENKIYCAAYPSLFVFDQADNSLEKVTKSDGLSDLGVSTIKYSSAHKMVILGYDNGNIDLIFNNEIINVPDIKRSYISADKKINEILVDGNVAFLSAGFGIVQLDLLKRELKETFSFGPLGTYLAVNESCIVGDSLWAATDEGIYVGDVRTNLSDFQNWVKTAALPSGKYNTIVNYKGKVISNFSSPEYKKDTVYEYLGGKWTKIPLGPLYDNDDINDLNVTDDELIVATSFSCDTYDEFYTQKKTIIDYGTGVDPQPTEVIRDGSTYWISDRVSGLVQYNSSFSVYLPKGPYYSDAWGLAYSDGYLWVTGGNLTPNLKFSFIRAGISRLDISNDDWTSYLGDGLDSITDLHSIIVDPNDPQHVYAASYGKGIVNFKDGEIINVFNETNSTVQSLTWGFRAIGGITRDNEGVIYATNSEEVSYPLVAYDGQDNWYKFSFQEISGASKIKTTDVVVDQYNNKYVIAYLTGILVFNENGTLSDPSDDRKALIKAGEGSGNLPSNEVHAIAFDEDGKMLIGTASGLSVINSTQDVFTAGAAEADRIIIEQEDGAAYLLSEAVINVIKIDKANRKWIGTANDGIYLISADLQGEIAHFTAENSPLLSNYIVDLVFNEENGEVFISTDKGLCSYMSGVNDNENYTGPVYAFPNPVPPNFNGQIGIRGLPNNSEVKITDITGNLIFETISTGGTATWDGNSLNGDRAQSGVYIVFASNEKGTEKEVTKILFIN